MDDRNSDHLSIVTSWLLGGPLSLASDERAWLERELEAVRERSRLLAGEAAWHPRPN